MKFYLLFSFYLFILFSTLLFISNGRKASAQTINPVKFIATLKFDDQYQDYFTGKKEQMFPIAFTFNIIQDGNNDSIIDAEDACENIVRYSIGDSIYGTGRTGISNRGPNDQRPSVYFHFLKRENYDIYEYWLYYADNDYLNDHEHDWEKYFVYVQDTTPVYVMISNHSNFNLFSWCELPKDSTHIIIGVDGGAHAMGNNNQNGIKIRFNGEVSKNAGQLDYGDGQTFPWRIYSNDSNINDAINYFESPDDFFNGDPVYPDIPQLSSSEEYGSPSAAPWKRSEWDAPPPVPIVFLGTDKEICPGDSIQLNAGNGYSAYLWSTGETNQTIYVKNAGIYFVEVAESNGCKSLDTIVVSVCSTIEQKENESSIKVFPNPNKGAIFLQVNSALIKNSRELFFLLTDMNGKEVKKINNVKTEITEIKVENLSQGVYNYKIFTKKKIIYSEKLIID